MRCLLRAIGSVIAAGHLISMDGSDHVTMSAGRLLPNGEHEFYPFKGGGGEKAALIPIQNSARQPGDAGYDGQLLKPGSDFGQSDFVALGVG